MDSPWLGLHVTRDVVYIGTEYTDRAWHATTVAWRCSSETLWVLWWGDVGLRNRILSQENVEVFPVDIF